jgi:hypothetical protein
LVEGEQLRANITTTYRYLESDNVCPPVYSKLLQGESVAQGVTKLTQLSLESRLCHEIHQLHVARIRAEVPLQYFVNEGFDRDSVVDGNVPAGSSPEEVLVQGKRRANGEH